MSVLLDLRDRLQETHVAIARVEAAVVQHPDDETLALTIESLRQRHRELDIAFSEAANIEHVDICSYRLIADESDRFSVSAMTTTLSAFQSLVTVVYDALKTGAKVRARPSAEIVEQSTFDFEYAYPGSLGFVLTMPNERLLIGESDLDQAISWIFKMMKAESTEEVARFARQVGVASIR